MALLGLLLLDSFWFEKYIIEWNHFDISKGNDGKIKIIQISDLHFDELRSFHRSIAQKINLLQPDLLVFTGDTVDDNTRLEGLKKFLKLIDLSIVKFAITGNWEYWGGIDLNELKTVFESHNCTLLINEHRELIVKNRKLVIVGIDDYIGGNANFESAIDGIASPESVVVLTHCPEHRDVIQRENKSLKIDLVLSGHTHMVDRLQLLA